MAVFSNSSEKQVRLDKVRAKRRKMATPAETRDYQKILREALMIIGILFGVVGARYASRIVVPVNIRGELIAAGARIASGVETTMNPKDTGEPIFTHEENGLIGTYDFVSFGWQHGPESPSSTIVDGRVERIERTKFNYWKDPNGGQELSEPVEFRLKDNQIIRPVPDIRFVGYYYVVKDGRIFYFEYSENKTKTFELNPVTQDGATLKVLNEAMAAATHAPLQGR